ncbi:tetratricopeptide repeat protein [Silvibacterium sp.]|uniref:tetratricopeptide repeat protein n=1 Tax=Silvibacterium sp. TaxID=1964179 RepID=UPI0039E673EE
MEISSRQDTGFRPRTAVLVTAVCLLLAVPIVFLVGSHARSERIAEAPASPAVVSAPGDAVRQYEDAARRDPSPENRLNLSMAYLQAHAPGRALAILEALVREEPGNAPVWNNLCVAHVEVRDLGNAILECRRAIALSPGFQRARNNLAWAMQESAAEQASLVALERTPQAARDGQFFIQKSAYLIHLGRYDDAIVALHGAFAIDPKDPDAAINMGTALMLKHSPEEAVSWFRKAVAWSPDSQLAKNDLAWAEGR